MTRPRSSHITAAIASVLPRRRIRNLARKLGVVQRQRKFDIVAFVYSLTFGFTAGDRRTLAGLRRAYLRATGVRLAPSSFHARFTPELTELMRTVATDALGRASKRRPKLRALFAPFREVLAIDCALLRIHNSLEPYYPSVYRHYMKASIKLSMVMNVAGRGAKTVSVNPGSRHDVHLLKSGPWMKGRLLLFDLGFYRAALFNEISRNAGYFLTRMKKDGNPVIVRSHRRQQRRLVGLRLKDVQADARGTIDVDGTVVHQVKSKTKPLVSTRHSTFRCVAIHDAATDTWHRYVTNLPTDMMAAEHMPAVYAARWEVELLFRELKSHYRLDHAPSASKHVTEALIYASVLTLLASRALYHAFICRTRVEATRLPFDRWAVLLATMATELLEVLVSRHDREHRARRLERFLRAEACDPNRARTPLPHKAQAGIRAPA